MEPPRYQTRAFERAQVGLGNDKGLQSEESSGTEGAIQTINPALMQSIHYLFTQYFIDTSLAEGRSRRKFQRTATDIDNAAFRKPVLPASAMKQNTDAKSNLARRKSIQRENKPLLGPRPLDSSSGKR